MRRRAACTGGIQLPGLAPCCCCRCRPLPPLLPPRCRRRIRPAARRSDACTAQRSPHKAQHGLAGADASGAWLCRVVGCLCDQAGQGGTLCGVAKRASRKALHPECGRPGAVPPHAAYCRCCPRGEGRGCAEAAAAAGREPRAGHKGCAAGAAGLAGPQLLVLCRRREAEAGPVQRQEAGAQGPERRIPAALLGDPGVEGMISAGRMPLITLRVQGGCRAPLEPRPAGWLLHHASLAEPAPAAAAAGGRWPTAAPMRSLLGQRQGLEACGLHHHATRDAPAHKQTRCVVKVVGDPSAQ